MIIPPLRHIAASGVDSESVPLGNAIMRIQSAHNSLVMYARAASDPGSDHVAASDCCRVSQQSILDEVDVIHEVLLHPDSKVSGTMPEDCATICSATDGLRGAAKRLGSYHGDPLWNPPPTYTEPTVSPRHSVPVADDALPDSTRSPKRPKLKRGAPALATAAAEATDADLLGDPRDWDDVVEDDSEVTTEERCSPPSLLQAANLPIDEVSQTHASLAEQQGLFNPISNLRSASACSSTVPMTQIPVGTKHLLTLWDTGASFCVLSAVAAQSLFGDLWEYRLCKLCFLPTFELADGSKTKSRGRITVPLRFNKKAYHQDFYVLDSHSVPAILGVDFFIKVGATIDFGKSVIHLANMKGCPPLPFKISKKKTSFRGSLSPIFLTDTLEIKSGEQVLVRGRVSNSDPLANLPPVSGVVTRIRRGTDPRHCCSNAVSTLKNSTVNVQLANLTSLPSVIRKGSIVGYFQTATILSPEEAATTVFDDGDNVVDIRSMWTLLLRFQRTVHL